MKFDVIFLDYMQNTRQNAKTKVDGYDEYIRHFREMAIRYNFAAVLLSQINRTSQEGSDKKPYMHQMKGTGYLEEHSDAILLLHWPHKYDEKVDTNHYEVYIAKNKSGSTGSVNLRFYPQFSLFRQPDYAPSKPYNQKTREAGDVVWEE